MITDAIIQAFLAGVAFLVGLMPETGPGGISEEASASAAGFGAAAEGFFPVSTTVVVLVGLLAMELALLLWDLIVFVYHQIWGSD